MALNRCIGRGRAWHWMDHTAALSAGVHEDQGTLGSPRVSIRSLRCGRQRLCRDRPDPKRLMQGPGRPGRWRASGELAARYSSGHMVRGLWLRPLSAASP